MTRFLPCFLIFWLMSCRDAGKPTLENILKSDCFWDRTGDKQVIGGLNSCYRFLPDGQCYFYFYNFKNRKLTGSVFRYDDDDVIVPNTWSVVGDTLLIARNTHYKVLSFVKDSITVEGYLNDTMVFRKNCRTVLEK